MSIIERYDQVFCEIFSVDPSKLDDSFTFAGTEEWNSLAHMELIAALEDEFDVMLDPEEITHFGSYEHGKEILRAHGVGVS